MPRLFVTKRDEKKKKTKWENVVLKSPLLCKYRVSSKGGAAGSSVITPTFSCSDFWLFAWEKFPPPSPLWSRVNHRHDGCSISSCSNITYQCRWRGASVSCITIIIVSRAALWPCYICSFGLPLEQQCVTLGLLVIFVHLPYECSRILGEKKRGKGFLHKWCKMLNQPLNNCGLCAADNAVISLIKTQKIMANGKEKKNETGCYTVRTPTPPPPFPDTHSPKPCNTRSLISIPSTPLPASSMSSALMDCNDRRFNGRGFKPCYMSVYVSWSFFVKEQLLNAFFFLFFTRFDALKEH